MKITKIFTGVFLLTFFIGIISFYLLILKTEKNAEQLELILRKGT
jgi:CHASE3 domain sensor protein